MPVRTMLREMSSRELMEWAAWFTVKDEPLPKGQQGGQDMWEQVRAATMGAPDGKAARRRTPHPKAG